MIKLSKLHLEQLGGCAPRRNYLARMRNNLLNAMGVENRAAAPGPDDGRCASRLDGDVPATAHVVMLWNYLPTHFLSTMRCLSKKLGRLTFVLSEVIDPGRAAHWKPELDGFRVVIQRSLALPVMHRHPVGFKYPGRILVPYSTIGDLLRIDPDVVIALEVGPRTILALLHRTLGARYKLIIQVRESEITAMFRGRFRRWVRKLVLPCADRVLVNGYSGLRYVLACGVKPQMISVVPSGTDLTTFGSKIMQERSDDSLRLLYVGALIELKGIMPFAHALAEVASQHSREIHWTLIGEGPLAENLSKLALPPGLSVEVLAPCSYGDLPAHYGQHDVFVMPSLADEWGMVVNEAMAMGLPVLGSNGCVAVEEMVEERTSGWKYAPGNASELRNALTELLSRSKAELRVMGENARAAAFEISDERVAEMMMKVVRDVMCQHPE